MSEVISMRSFKEEREPHVGGECVCMACDHEWHAVAPIPLTGELECPNCSLHRARFKYNLAPSEDTLIFNCNCGCDNFFVTTRGVFCINCGTSIPFSDLCE